MKPEILDWIAGIFQVAFWILIVILASGLGEHIADKMIVIFDGRVI